MIFLSAILAFVLAVIAGSIAVYFGASEFTQGAFFGTVFASAFREFLDD
jgi:hypothetical protein